MALVIAAAVTTGEGLPGGYCEISADVISYQRGRLWYWEMLIDVEYEDCPPEGQNGSAGQVTALVPLSQV